MARIHYMSQHMRCRSLMQLIQINYQRKMNEGVICSTNAFETRAVKILSHITSKKKKKSNQTTCVLLLTKALMMGAYIKRQRAKFTLTLERKRDNK